LTADFSCRISKSEVLLHKGRAATVLPASAFRNKAGYDQASGRIFSSEADKELTVHHDQSVPSGVDSEGPFDGAQDETKPGIKPRGGQRTTNHRPATSGLVRAINAAGRLLPRNVFSVLRLDYKKLLQKACESTSLDDFGEDSFRQPLRLLLDSFERDAQLNFIGRICAHSDIYRMLCNRLRLVEDRKRHPGVSDEIVRAPIFITGLPRSGTTLLHALLAQDPDSRAPRVWEVMHPSPPPAAPTYDTDPRIEQTEKELRWLKVIMPDFETVHLMNAKLPQECIAITAHSFISNEFESMYHVWSYRSWLDKTDKRGAYEFHKQFLQHLQWRCPGSHWVLKAPSHLLALDALMQVYPDARIIMTHRDPLKVMASCASFSEVLRGPFTVPIDRMKLGPEIQRRWVEGAGLAVKFHQHNGNLGGRLLDVQYSDLVREPMSVVRSIYRQYDMELTGKAETAMQAFLSENPKDKKGTHRYSLEDYGLNPEAERRSFGFYTDYFKVEPE
jgi:hypothetical protein